MTTITFGGGPTIEARRSFSNLKPGTEVPGYGGYIHQFKYNSGHTYGDQTHILAEKFASIKQRHKSALDLPLVSAETRSFKSALPKATTGNKLTETMVPGYTGYIPSRKFHFSDRYKTECDDCIESFLHEKDSKLKKDSDLMTYVNSQPKYTPIADSQDLREKLALKTDRDLTNYQNDKRQFTEPPIPGYTGYIPKIKPTELGLGSRYHLTTERGLNQFQNDYLRSKTSVDLKKSVHFERSESMVDYLDVSKPASKKIYVKPGMIPKYTGYIHGRKFEFGNTYGDTTRSLPVCSHTAPSFGDYMDKNPPKTFIC
ncbi:hypothetical protein BpHYR1_039371 [Brachionus plicatilis]|uniref:Protein FAM166B n=1 Tax=Brachionus plicatilis TaxID=10195 RepID=A0A3M7SU91_BRAPC|nr:hypothetical protein BpHYR1_039371 [Brachionus plicatilis]